MLIKNQADLDVFQENVWNNVTDIVGILNEVFEVMLSFTPASI